MFTKRYVRIVKKSRDCDVGHPYLGVFMNFRDMKMRCLIVSKKQNNNCEDMIIPPFAIHHVHSTSFVMPNGDPRGGSILPLAYLIICNTDFSEPQLQYTSLWYLDGTRVTLQADC